MFGFFRKLASMRDTPLKVPASAYERIVMGYPLSNLEAITVKNTREVSTIMVDKYTRAFVAKCVAHKAMGTVTYEVRFSLYHSREVHPNYVKEQKLLFDKAITTSSPKYKRK